MLKTDVAKFKDDRRTSMNQERLNSSLRPILRAWRWSGAIGTSILTLAVVFHKETFGELPATMFHFLLLVASVLILPPSILVFVGASLAAVAAWAEERGWRLIWTCCATIISVSVIVNWLVGGVSHGDSPNAVATLLSLSGYTLFAMAFILFPIATLGAISDWAGASRAQRRGVTSRD